MESRSPWVRLGLVSLMPAYLALFSGCSELPMIVDAPPGATGVATSTSTSTTDPQIVSALINLAQTQGNYHVDLTNVQTGSPLSDMLSLGSPIGYSLRTRYLTLGIPISEALSRNPDPAFKDNLVMLARWDRASEVRSAGLITLAGAHDPASLDVFREALIHLDPAVRFSALEALTVWGHPDMAVPLLSAAAEKDSEPILRVYAAASLARLGDPSGLTRLRAFLDDPSWLVRAMAGRYLGEFGTGQDYDLLVSRIGGEQANDFVVAEYCIAALKLFPKKQS